MKNKLISYFVLAIIIIVILFNFWSIAKFMLAAVIILVGGILGYTFLESLFKKTKEQ